jgi:hypothetical protein
MHPLQNPVDECYVGEKKWLYNVKTVRNTQVRSVDKMRSDECSAWQHITIATRL